MKSKKFPKSIRKHVRMLKSQIQKGIIQEGALVSFYESLKSGKEAKNKEGKTKAR